MQAAPSRRLPALLPGLVMVLCWVLPLCWLSGCGAPAAPQPPTLNLPQPVSDLFAARSGNTVRLSFVVPQKTTDRLPVRGAITARACRMLEGESCQPVGSLTVKPLQAAVLEDALPAALAAGAPRLLTYRVMLENTGGKSAAASNPAYALAGEAPAGVAALTATARREGIVLGWQPGALTEDAKPSLRFDRVRTAGAPPPPTPRPGDLPTAEQEPEPAEQTLQAPEASLPADAARPLAVVDATARTGRSYRYTAQRVAHYVLAGHALEMASAPSAPVQVVYRDVFPPPPPTGLVSAVDTPGRAIDLSWSPGQDPHVSGYAVYRRNAGDSNTQRLTPAGKPVTLTAWRDTTAIAGQRYAYSVTALDPAGNESAHSAEVEERLPPPDAQP